MNTPTKLEQLSPALVHPVGLESIHGDAMPSDGTHRAIVRTVAGMQKEAIVTHPEHSWRLSSDEGDYLDGDDIAPCPLGNMVTGMVATYLDSIIAAIDEQDITLNGLDVTLDNYYTMQGSALRGDMTGGALDPELTVDIDVADGDDTEVESLIREAINSAMITDVMETALSNPFTLTLNGEELTTDRVPQLERSSPIDPDTAFTELSRPAGDTTEIIHRTGETTEDFPEDREQYTAGSGSSLESEQDRILHIRGHGTLRDDGQYHITQKIYSPKGTIFEFLADRHPSIGGKHRSPTGATYIAAGIGFCFLTQFGRYAEIKRKQLDEYRIIQDVPWSGDPNDTDRDDPEPIQTHVHVDSPEGVDFAKDLLDFSEQTCFLHALCREEVTPQVTVSID